MSNMLDLIFTDFVIKRPPADPDMPGSPWQVPSIQLDGLYDNLFLILFQIHHGNSFLWYHSGFKQKIPGRQSIVIWKNDSLIKGVLQFPDIARPVVFSEFLYGPIGYAYISSIFITKLFEKKFNK